MASRTNVRLRPLELAKQLPIIRDIAELDAPTDGAKDVLSTVEAREEEAKKPKKGSEIPIPMVRVLPSYERDYLPVFQEQTTYIRGRGGFGHKDENFVEYDLDTNDREWLDKFNKGQDRLPARRFELLIWRLELINAEANERHFSATGANLPDRLSPGFAAQIGNLKRDEALQALSRTHALRQPVLLAVYSYWRQKRVNRGKPLLRSLQAPTAPSDSNPFNVFRPRDKIHRPQTRRRRENNEESLDKMRTLRTNLVRAYEVHEWLTRREARKYSLVYTEVDLQQLRIKQRHDSPERQAATEAEYLEQASTKTASRPLHLENQRPSYDINHTSTVSMPADLTRFKRRKKDKKEAVQPAVNQLSPPPLPPEPEMLFSDQPDVEEVAQKSSEAGWPLPESLRSHRPRIGRGGRLLFDRCQPFTNEPFDTDSSREKALEAFDSISIKAEPGPHETGQNSLGLANGISVHS